MFSGVDYFRKNNVNTYNSIVLVTPYMCLLIFYCIYDMLHTETFAHMNGHWKSYDYPHISS